MARRIADARGEYLPQLEAGLREGWAWLSDARPAMRSTIVEALDIGEPFPVDGGTVWSALQRVDPAEADAFRRRCGWVAGAPSAWLSVDRTQWTFDPRRALLSRTDRRPKGVAEQ